MRGVISSSLEAKKKKSLISVLDGLSLLYNMFYRKRAMFVQKEVPER